MYIKILVVGFIIAILTYVVVTKLLRLKFKTAFEWNTRFISLDETDTTTGDSDESKSEPKLKSKLESVRFKWIGDSEPNKTYNLESFVLPQEDDQKVIRKRIKIVEDTNERFKVYTDDKLIVERDCLSGYHFTKLGCIQNPSCKGKSKDEFVADKHDRFTIHKCDGENGISETHTCYGNQYLLLPPYPCGYENPCFNKPDGIIESKVIESYVYWECVNGLVVEKYCDRFKEYFDRNVTNKCLPLPPECTRLQARQVSDIILLPQSGGGVNGNQRALCLNTGHSINLLLVRRGAVEEGGRNGEELLTTDEGNNGNAKENAYGDCDPHTSHGTPINVPPLWSTSTSYKMCVDRFWTVMFCNNTAAATTATTTTSQFQTMLTEIRNTLPDGILFTIPNLDGIRVFDKKLQTCVPFDYRYHYKMGKVPLIYRDPLMTLGNALPLFEYDTKKKAVTEVNSVGSQSDSSETKVYKLNMNFDAYEVISGGDNSNSNNNNNAMEQVDTIDIEKCNYYYSEYLKKYNDKFDKFLGVYTVAYDNVILSCRYRKVINKMVVDKHENDNFWDRTSDVSDTYKIGNKKLIKCKGKYTLHKIIPTCVNNSCTRVDYTFPKNLPIEYPTLGSNYSNKNLCYCSRYGEILHTVPINNEFKRLLGKYCRGYVGDLIHPFYNLPITCKQDDESVELINNRLQKDPSLNLLNMEDDSIFKTDQNAFYLYFLEGRKEVD